MAFKFPQNTDEDYKAYAEKAWKISVQEINDDKWILDKTNSKNDKIYSKKSTGKKKAFKIVGEIECPADLLISELRADKIDKVCQWNPTLKECKVITKFCECSGLFYQKTAEGAGGIVASRDFINVFYERESDDSFVISYASVTHKDYPPRKRVIRGWNEPGATVISKVPDDPNKCLFTWMFSCDFKFRLVPEKIMSEIFRFVSGEQARCLRKLARRILKDSASKEVVTESELEDKQWKTDTDKAIDKYKLEKAKENIEELTI